MKKPEETSLMNRAKLQDTIHALAVALSSIANLAIQPDPVGPRFAGLAERIASAMTTSCEQLSKEA